LKTAVLRGERREGSDRKGEKREEGKRRGKVGKMRGQATKYFGLEPP